MATVVLTIDPAQSTGYCIAEIDDAGHATIIEYGYLDVDTTSEFMGDWCNNLAGAVESLIKASGATAIAVEDYFFSSRFTSGANVNPAYRAAIHMTVRRMGLPYTILNISQWKSFVAGRSVPTKEQKKKWGKQAANKLFIAQALWDRYKIRFPNHSISEKTGKPIKFRYDVVDAVAQMVCFCKLHLNASSLSCSVAVPADVDMGKLDKHQITYS